MAGGAAPDSGMGLSASAESARISIDRLTFFCDAVHVRNVVLMAVFGVSMPLAFLVNRWAFITWALIPAGMWLGTVIAQRRAANRGAPA